MSRAPAAGVPAAERPAGGAWAYRARVSHQRRTPIRHGFSYRTTLWLVDLDRPPVVRRPLRHRLDFRAADHLSGRGSGGPRAIRAELDAWLATRGVRPAAAERVYMLTGPRTAGHVFNPLTVYYCHAADGALRHVVAEVHNTYGGRHRYLLDVDEAGRARTDKRFYVSPFFGVAGEYLMRFGAPGPRLHVTIALRLPDGEVAFVATLDCRKVATTDRSGIATGAVLRTLLKDPLPGYRVPLLIRIQGVRLLLRGLRITPRPAGAREEDHA